MHLMGHDVFMNVAGRVRLDEPAVDLGIVSAVASSFLDRCVPGRTLVFGEVGLAGEVRAVGQVDARLARVAAHCQCAPLRPGSRPLPPPTAPR